MREILALPNRLSGIGIVELMKESGFEYEASKTISALYAHLVVQQSLHLLPNEDEVKQLISNVKAQRLARSKDSDNLVDQKLPESLQKTLSRARDKEASNWLTDIPLEDAGMNVLNKEEFRDALCLRYDLTLKGLPSKCPCNNTCNISHALNCKKGCPLDMRHDEIRKHEAKSLSEVCKDVAIDSFRSRGKTSFYRLLTLEIMPGWL